MGISTGGPGTKPGPGVKTAATWPSAASPAGKRRSDRSPGAALCGHLERAPPQTPTPGEASEELGAETCAVKEAVNRLSHQVRGYWRCRDCALRSHAVSGLRCLHSEPRGTLRALPAPGGSPLSHFLTHTLQAPGRCSHLSVGAGPGERHPEVQDPIPSVPARDGWPGLTGVLVKCSP